MLALAQLPCLIQGKPVAVIWNIEKNLFLKVYGTEH